jgi:hypothetical protein
MALPQFPVEGGCLCGRVRYRLDAAPLSIYRCHCKDCQRTSGAAFSMSALIRAGDIVLIKGELVGYEKTADSGRHLDMKRCAHCGTLIWNEPESHEYVTLKPGTLDDSSWVVPVGNIWTASRQPWTTISPDEPSYPGQAVPNRDALIAAWARSNPH